jgi:hypothetical protein
VPDPLAALAAPAPSVGQSSVNLTSGSLTINPGMYIQISVSGTGSLTMNPGVYIVGGGGFSVTQSASVNGTGVLIYNAGSNFDGSGTSLGSITLTGQGGINLTPGSTGPYAGIVIFQSPDNSRAISLSAQAELALANSIIYAPAALLTVSGNALVENALVVNRLLLGVNLGSPQTPNDPGNASQGLLLATVNPWPPRRSGVVPSFGEIIASQSRRENGVEKVLSATHPASVSAGLAHFATVSPKRAHRARLIEELFARSSQGNLYSVGGE